MRFRGIIVALAMIVTHSAAAQPADSAAAQAAQMPQPPAAPLAKPRAMPLPAPPAPPAPDVVCVPVAVMSRVFAYLKRQPWEDVTQMIGPLAGASVGKCEQAAPVSNQPKP